MESTLIYLEIINFGGRRYKMKIGINLVGVSYNNAIEGGRLRDYENSIENFYKNVVNPLKENGHDIKFYLFSYSNEITK